MYHSDTELAPVIVFCFKRSSEIRKTITTLAANYLADDTVLYIFSDGPRGVNDVKGVDDVRAYLKTITGFKQVVVKEHPVNLGLAKSVIGGVSAVLEKHGKAIVVEDDLVTSSNFLDFMNQALDFYEENNEVLSVSGFTLPLKNMPENDDFYTGYRASSWAWGTWWPKWKNIDWSVSDFNEFNRDGKSRRAFKRGGSDMVKMLRDQMEGRIDSWAIRFCYHQFKKNMVTIFPTISKAISIGYSSDATHTFNELRFRTTLDGSEKRVFLFKNNVGVEPQLAKDFRRFFSIRVRIADRLRMYAKKIKFVRH